MSHLKVFMPPPEYLLAMKVLAARANTMDRNDIEFLIGRLDLTNPEQVLEIVRHYYPHKQVKPATKAVIEELLGQG